MFHPSFRTTLLAGFLLITSILGSAAASGWLMLEHFSRDSREESRQALALSTAVQQLTERSIDLERSARQFLVLRQAALLERFDAARIEALAALHAVETTLPAAARTAQDWRAQANAIQAALLDTDSDTAAAGLPRSLGQLPALNEALAAEASLAVERSRSSLLASLERSRERLALTLAAALAAAVGLGAVVGWWTLRPLHRIKRAIARLGDDRLDLPVVVGGPADLQQLGQQLDWLRERLLALQADRDRVMRHVSHELKTPLASLREGIALLRDGVVGPLSREQQEVAAIVEHNARLLQSRIEQLLDFNAIRFDAARLTRRPVNLRLLASRVADAHRLAARARDLNISMSGSAPLVEGDEAKLETALSNVLGNAIAFAPSGSEIRIVLGHDGRTATIDCIDDGPGIPPEDLERIFEPFYQGRIRAERPCKGNGLGLAIVRELIAAHGGRIDVLSARRGAHFRLELPREQSTIAS